MPSMDKKLLSFRVKLILTFLLSMTLSSIVTYLAYFLLKLYYQNNALYGSFSSYFRQILRNIGDFNVFFIFFITLSFIFFYILTKPYSRYFSEISSGLHSLARGEFTHEVQINSNDEFKSIATDINSASKKLEKAIEQSKVSENSRNQLIVNLAHDLRTPLTSVIGYLDLIIKDEDLTDEEVQHYLSIAHNKSKRLERLIDELFEVTRMNYGMFEVKKTALDLSDLLNQLKEELYPLFEESELTARITGQSPIKILGEGDLLARVFENLLTNAIRYGADGQYVDIHHFIDQDEAIVRITNYGATISDDYLPYLFDMFSKGDHSRTQQENSTGLGLFIAKNIVKQHEGQISAESDVIKTVFEVRLPLNLDQKEPI